MSLEENKDIVRRHYVDVWSHGHVELIDGYFTPDGSTQLWGTLQNFREGVLWFRNFFPDLKMTVLDMIAEGDKVTIYWQQDATRTVEPEMPVGFPMPPLGRPFSWKGVDIVTIVDGKLVEGIGFSSWTDMLIEAGVPMSKPEPA